MAWLHMVLSNRGPTIRFMSEANSGATISSAALLTSPLIGLQQRLLLEMMYAAMHERFAEKICPLFPPDCMLYCRNRYAFSTVFCGSSRAFRSKSLLHRITSPSLIDSDTSGR